MLDPLAIYDSPGMHGEIEELILPEAQAGDPLYGESKVFYCRNESTVALENVTLVLEGDGAKNAQVALDVLGSPGDWHDSDGSLPIAVAALAPYESFRMWLRARFDPDDLVVHPVSCVFSGEKAG